MNTRHIIGYGNNTEESPLDAAEYIAQLRGRDLVRSKQEREAKRARQLNLDFVAFLRKEKPGLYLHEINTRVALEFLEYLERQGVSYAYKKARWARLGYVFNIVHHKFEDSVYHYRNPFYSIKLSRVAECEPVQHKKIFTAQQMRQLLQDALTFSGHNTRRHVIQNLQRWGILFLLALTGARPKDIILLKWESVNFAQRTLTICHSKTAKLGIRTVLWLTPHLMDFFVLFRQLHRQTPAEYPEYVFGFRNGKSRMKDIERYLLFSQHLALAKFFCHFRKNRGLTEYRFISGRRMHDYCVYSLRAGVGTLLTLANFNQNAIDYLQGHAPHNTTARFYLNLEADPHAATGDMLLYMTEQVLCVSLAEIARIFSLLASTA